MQRLATSFLIALCVPSLVLGCPAGSQPAGECEERVDCAPLCEAECEGMNQVPLTFLCNSSGECKCIDCQDPPGTGGAAGSSGSGGTGGMGGTGGTTAPPSELCTNGLDDDADELVDCEDVSDCACDRACVETFIEVCKPTNLLVNPGFELGIGDVGSMFPRDTGGWGGDLASVKASFIGTTATIEPFECNQMAQFDSAFIQPLPNDSTVADRVQLIDATGLQGQRICGTARFARDRVDEFTDTLFNVTTAYFVGPPSEFTDFAPGLDTSIDSKCFEDGRCANAGVDIPDGQVGEWKFVVSSTTIPAGDEPKVTALINVRASENEQNDATGDPGPEFDGHFVDNARLFAVPSDPSELSEDCLTALLNVDVTSAPPPDPSPPSACP